MPQRVLVCANMVEANLDSLAAFASVGIEVVRLSPQEGWDSHKLAQALRDVDGCILGGYQVTAAMMEQAPRLKVIARTGIGVETVDLAAATNRKIAVTNVAGTDHDAVADATFCLMLDIARRFYHGFEQVRAGRWQAIFGVDVVEKTLGIIGLGRIGKGVAMRAQGFRMTVLAYDVKPDREWAQQHNVSYVPLEELLGRSDFVSLNATLTESSRHLINRQTLALMKPTAYLINTSRGALVDEDALLEALQEKRIAGAALDVLTKEPPGESPFLKLDNVIITPHMGGSSIEASAKVCQVAVQNVIDLLQGRRPWRTVNAEIWS